MVPACGALSSNVMRQESQMRQSEWGVPRGFFSPEARRGTQIGADTASQWAPRSTLRQEARGPSRMIRVAVNPESARPSVVLALRSAFMHNTAFERAGNDKAVGDGGCAAASRAQRARSRQLRRGRSTRRYASRISDEAIGVGCSARILSAGSEARNGQRHRQDVPVGASHITPSVSARALG